MKEIADAPKEQRRNDKMGVTSYIGINLAGLNAMMSARGSQPEPLRKDTESG